MGFEHLARSYRALEWLLAGGVLQRARTRWLGELGAPEHALLVGEGPGRFLEVGLRRLPRTRFHCVDACAGMLREAARRVGPGDQGRVAFEQADLRSWKPAGGGYDLIVTHFFLDCFPAPVLGRVVGALAEGLAAGGVWLVADFAMPASGPARWRAWVIHRLMYGFFRLATDLPARALEPPEDWLQAEGLVLARGMEFEWGLIRSSMWRRPGPSGDG